MEREEQQEEEEECALEEEEEEEEEAEGRKRPQQESRAGSCQRSSKRLHAIAQLKVPATSALGEVTTEGLLPPG